MKECRYILFLSIFLCLTSCSLTKKIKDGTTAFDRKQYSVAIELFQDEYRSASSDTERAKIAYKTAESYANIGRNQEALDWYRRASTNGYDKIALVREAFTLKKLEKYQEAQKLFKRLDSELNTSYNFKREVAICRLADTWLAKIDEASYKVEPVPFNTIDDEYAPILLKNRLLFYTSDKKHEDNQGIYKWTGRDFSDIYMYNIDSKQETKLDPRINTTHNEGTATFLNDGDQMIFTRCLIDSEDQDDYCQLMISDLVNGEWKEPEYLPFVAEDANYGHPFWIQKDSILFFSSKQNGGYGGFDIYFTQLDSMATWSRPVALSSKINTIGDEKFPSFYNDTLYFASDGLAGMGGLDIFYTFLDKNGNWVTPYNMKAPINSGSDDFGITLFTDSRRKDIGFFTSARNGSDDIFAIKKNHIPKETENNEPKEENLFVAVSVLTKDSNGAVLPTSTADISINSQMTNQKLNEQGFLIQEVDAGNYKINVKKSGFYAQSKELICTQADIPMDQTNYTYQITFVLEPIIANKEIVLENIFYDFGEFAIRDDAKPSLNELAELLLTNPEISIELSSHTDCRGNDPFNLKLSQQRAQAAVDYLVQRGINASRMIAKGYGETDPTVTCACDDCTEEQHQLNRRTSFKVINFSN